MASFKFFKISQSLWQWTGGGKVNAPSVLDVDEFWAGE
jgi:hypothetical protein